MKGDRNIQTYHLTSPLSEEDVARLRVGDLVFISGNAFTCRSRLHRYIFDEGGRLPIDTQDRNVLIHTGPIVINNGQKWDMISFMPTSSIRFEKWGARSVEHWGLKMIVGKTTMGAETAAMMKEKKCVHVSPQCVSPNLWVDSIVVEDVKLYDELGAIEAVWCLRLTELGPFIVDIDSTGKNLFDGLYNNVRHKRSNALKILGVPDDFEYTKLYG